MRVHQDVMNGLIEFSSGGSIPVDNPSATKQEMAHAETAYEAASDKGLATAEIHWVGITDAKSMS